MIISSSITLTHKQIMKCNAIAKPNVFAEILFAGLIITTALILHIYKIEFGSSVPQIAVSPSVVKFKVEGLCCNQFASLVIAELLEEPGVIGVKPDIQTRTIRVEFNNHRSTSTRNIWEAIERTGVRPVNLVAELRPCVQSQLK